MMRDRISVALIAASVVVADQLTKWIVSAQVSLHDRVPVIDGLLDITHVQNRGAAFGLFADIQSPALRWGLIVVSIAAVGLIWAYARDGWDRPATVVAFGVIVGGAAGNLVDRLVHGFVVDFVLVHWNGYHWPSFNVADAAITVGAGMLFLAMARDGDDAHPMTADAVAGDPVPAPDEQHAEDCL